MWGNTIFITSIWKVNSMYKCTFKFTLWNSISWSVDPIDTYSMVFNSHLIFLVLAFSTNFCPIKSDLSGNTVGPQASGFQKLVKMDDFFFIFYQLLSTQNVNVARFARNVEWYFFCDFQTPCVCRILYMLFQRCCSLCFFTLSCKAQESNKSWWY